MKKAIFILMMAPLLATAQLHINFGVTDISQRMDGNTTVWGTGFTHFFDNGIGTGAHLNYTLVANDNYYTLEIFAKYRFSDGNYRFEAGPGLGYNFDDMDIHPSVHTRNSFKIGNGIWLMVDLDNSVRWGYLDDEDSYTKARRETQFKIGLSIDIDYSMFKGKPRRNRL